MNLFIPTTADMSYIRGTGKLYLYEQISRCQSEHELHGLLMRIVGCSFLGYRERAWRP